MKKVLEKFVGSENSLTFASAFPPQWLVGYARREFFDEIYIRQ